MNQYRQGDVLLVEIKSIPEGTTEVECKGGRVVLAEGESTGHAHVMATRNIVVSSVGTTLFLRVLHDTLLKHEEHKEINVRTGNYRVVRQREYSPEGIRNVAD